MIHQRINLSWVIRKWRLVLPLLDLVIFVFFIVTCAVIRRCMSFYGVVWRYMITLYVVWLLLCGYVSPLFRARRDSKALPCAKRVCSTSGSGCAIEQVLHERSAWCLKWFFDTYSWLSLKQRCTTPKDTMQRHRMSHDILLPFDA